MLQTLGDIGFHVYPNCGSDSMTANQTVGEASKTFNPLEASFFPEIYDSPLRGYGTTPSCLDCRFIPPTVEVFRCLCGFCNL